MPPTHPTGARPPEHETRRESVLRSRFLAVGVVALAVWTGAPWLMAELWGVTGIAGELSDVYEAVSALFSGLAFVGLLAALAFQRHDLKLQRRELAYQRQELAAAVAAQQDSARALEERLRQEEIHAHQRLCVDLLKEWHSVEMQRSRDVVDRCLQGHRKPGGTPLPRLEYYDAASHTPADDEVFAIFRILHFFEKLADLADAGLIETPLSAKLLGRYLAYWEDSLFGLLRENDPAPLHRIKLAKVGRLARDFREADPPAELRIVGAEVGAAAV